MRKDPGEAGASRETPGEEPTGWSDNQGAERKRDRRGGGGGAGGPGGQERQGTSASLLGRWDLIGEFWPRKNII